MNIVIGFYDKSDIEDMLRESSKMYKFKHQNVLTLNGVCLDGGPAPFIIMPFMANGSLLTYLKKNRNSLVISIDEVEEVIILSSMQDITTVISVLEQNVSDSCPSGCSDVKLV